MQTAKVQTTVVIGPKKRPNGQGRAPHATPLLSTRASAAATLSTVEPILPPVVKGL